MVYVKNLQVTKKLKNSKVDAQVILMNNSIYFINYILLN